MVIINTHRHHYKPTGVSTMTIADLIKELQTYNPTDKICLSFDNGYMFGGISPDDIEERDDRELEEEY